MQTVGRHPEAIASLFGLCRLFCFWRYDTFNVIATKGKTESEVASAVVRFQREQQGRGATDVRAHLLGDLLVVRCGGIWTPTEAHLAASEEGRRLIKSARQELRAINRGEIEDILARIVGCDVVRSYYDLAVDAAEQVEVYVLSVDIEKRLLRQDTNKSIGTESRRATNVPA